MWPMELCNSETIADVPTNFFKNVIKILTCIKKLAIFVSSRTWLKISRMDQNIRGQISSSKPTSILIPYHVAH